MMHVKRIFLFTFFITTTLLYVSAQNSVTAKLHLSDSGLLKDTIAPQFEGGEEALNDFVSNNTKYPYIALDNQIGGTVRLRFLVSKTGEIIDIRLIRGLDASCDREAFRTVRAMPKWIPATYKGKAIDAEQEIFIYFDLEAGLKQRETDKRRHAQWLEDNNPILADTTLNRKPQFPGGENALNAFIKTNLRYPKKALKVRAEGRVILRFTVSPTGELGNLYILRGLYPPCDEEAVYVFQNMPKWIPGLQNGEPVSMQVILPIEFLPPKVN